MKAASEKTLSQLTIIRRIPRTRWNVLNAAHDPLTIPSSSSQYYDLISNLSASYIHVKWTNSQKLYLLHAKLPGPV